MKPETEKLLIDAREAARAVLQFVSGRSLADYKANLMLRSAVERQMFILGETIFQLRKADLPSLERISEARRIVGFRDLLAHGYGQVDDARVWDMIENDLPKTLAEVDRLLAER